MNDKTEPHDLALADAPSERPVRRRHWLMVPAALGIVGGTLLAVDTLLPTDHRPEAVAARQASTSPPTTSSHPSATPPINDRLIPQPLTVGTMRVGLAVRGLVQVHQGPFLIPAAHQPGYERRARVAQSVVFDPPGVDHQDWHQPTYNMTFQEGLTEQEIDDYRVGNEGAGGRVVDGMFVLTEAMDSSDPDSAIWTSVSFSPGPGRFVSINGRNIDEATLIDLARSVSSVEGGGR